MGQMLFEVLAADQTTSLISWRLQERKNNWKYITSSNYQSQRQVERHSAVSAGDLMSVCVCVCVCVSLSVCVCVCVCVHIVFHILFHYGLSQNFEFNSLYYIVGPCCLLIFFYLFCFHK